MKFSLSGVCDSGPGNSRPQGSSPNYWMYGNADNVNEKTGKIRNGYSDAIDGG